MMHYGKAWGRRIWSPSPQIGAEAGAALSDHAGIDDRDRGYLHALAFNASSMDSLMPLEIELADRLIGHYISGFDFSADPKPSSVYWVDAALAQGPKTMAKLPQVVTPTLRFFSPGSVPQAIADTIRLVERGDLPTA